MNKKTEDSCSYPSLSNRPTAGARVRYLLPAPSRQDRLSRDADRRHRRQHGDRPAPFLEADDPGEGHQRLHQLARGIVTSGLAIYDTINYVKSPVSTICIGQAASMGSLLLSAGTKGKRYSLPNARIMIHQPLRRFQGQATDIEIHAREILRMREVLIRDLRQAHGPGDRTDPDGHGARLLHDGRSGQGVRPDRRGDRRS